VTGGLASTALLLQIARCPSLLFVSSNPLISDVEEYPTARWSDAHTNDLFERRYGGGSKVWMEDATKGLRVNTSRRKANQFLHPLACSRLWARSRCQP